MSVPVSPTLWVLRMELKFLAIVASAFIHWTASPALAGLFDVAAIS